ncbi:transcriptional regulator with XRE-family HTH domain [Nitrosospira sp. Nsp5]|uniref:Transcriptional regulator, contains XRE-family HTH domain n=1 Tax=Nitrosospira multiformis TaxID=1231 RepID=A0ABY0TE76_9PROT|nr:MULTISPECIES: helix-turn-helix transcriptional regulator [Nitrosospira]PTR05347.1 transcriptional regulator with XRE-family HTH domain [Nitrosospira sp. Nsp5]SDQ66669.1 Transcriptional regulator, contains XRE-family HTH domain [Nitrosospira multiformis]
MPKVSPDHPIGSRIVQLRREYSLTQSRLGEMCGVTKAAVSTWENGVAMPEIKKLLIIRSKLVFSFDWLITGEGEMSRAFDIMANFTERRHASRRDSRWYDRRQVLDRRDRQQHDRRKNSGAV